MEKVNILPLRFISIASGIVFDDGNDEDYDYDWRLWNHSVTASTMSSSLLLVLLLASTFFLSSRRFGTLSSSLRLGRRLSLWNVARISNRFHRLIGELICCFLSRSRCFVRYNWFHFFSFVSFRDKRLSNIFKCKNKSMCHNSHATLALHETSSSSFSTFHVSALIFCSHFFFILLSR